MASHGIMTARCFNLAFSKDSLPSSCGDMCVYVFISGSLVIKLIISSEQYTQYCYCISLDSLDLSVLDKHLLDQTIFDSYLKQICLIIISHSISFLPCLS